MIISDALNYLFIWFTNQCSNSFTLAEKCLIWGDYIYPNGL